MSGKVLKYLILVAIILLIVSISSFWFTGPSFREKDVVLEIEGPTQISAGSEAVYVLKYANNTRSTLYGLEFQFTYPEGSAVSVDGKLLEDHVEDFTVEELTSGSEGRKEFSAYIMGDKGSIKVAKAVVTFKAGSLSSVFEKSSNLSTTIVDTPISLTLVAPPSAVSGSKVQYILDYRNLSDDTASDMMLEFDYPDGFRSDEYEPKPSSGNNIWQIDSLKKGTGERVSISGTLSGREGENKIVLAKLKRKLGGEYVDYQRVSAVTIISNPLLELGVSVNGSADYSASLGDRLLYKIKYSNNSNFNLSGMNLTAKLEGEMYDLSTLDTRGGFFDNSSRTITWNSSTIPEFANFGPSSDGEISFSLSIRPNFSSSAPGTSQDRFVKATVKLSTPNTPTDYNWNEVETTSSLVTKISTQPTFNQSLYYNDPDFGASGPFPMRVGEETAYTVHWILTNPGNDVDQVTISAKLPSGVQWDNMTKSNSGLPVPSFNPNSSEVTWSFQKLPYGTGIVMDKYQASFRIRVKPSSLQRGSIVPLLETSRFSGTDNFTKQTITLTRGAVGSDGLTDKPREGTVQ